MPLPNLPEVEEIPVNGLENVRIQLPELPPINLPAYTANYVSGPYVKVKVGNPAPVPVSVPAPAPIVAAPVVQESYYQPPVLQYQHFPTSYVGNTPLYNSYGVAIPVDSYSIAASDQAPQYAAPAQNQQEQAQLPQEHFKNFKNGKCSKLYFSEIRKCGVGMFRFQISYKSYGDLKPDHKTAL